MSVHLLNIGINYQDDWGELRGCIPDARLLNARWGPYCDTATLLLENKADREGILRAGRAVLDRCGPGDLFAITQSSHGTREKYQGRYVEAVVCRDFELIYDYEMAGLLADRAAGVGVFALVDACHSGTIHRGSTFRPRALPLSRCKTHAHEKNTTARSLRNAWGFHGCGDGPEDYSYDGEFYGRPNGALTWYVETARNLLRPGATFADWFKLVAGVLPSDDYPQTPAVVGSRKNLRRPVPFL